KRAREPHLGRHAAPRHDGRSGGGGNGAEVAGRGTRSPGAGALSLRGDRTLAAVDSSTPLVERLVAFWSNHFTVSIQRGAIAGLCGPFEREAIRPHVLGRFAEMLNAVLRHPAMLLYLDNARSIGPNSLAGMRNPDKGINENLGRELLELHTLGVNGGYTQKDVEAMA